MANALAYKPKEKLGKFPQGAARIKVGSKAAKITFIGENAPEFDTGDVFKQFDLTDLPHPPRLVENSNDVYFVKLNRDADEVLSIGPVEGVFPAKCIDLSRRTDAEDPAPYEISGVSKDGGREFNYLAFNAYWQIISGPFKGVKISQFHHYKFTSNEDGETIWDGQPDNSKAKWLPKLVDFCEKTDCIAEPIEWPKDGNVLPELLERILAKHKEVQIVVKNGYIDSLVGSGSHYEYEDDEDVDKAFPAKAKANGKKAVKTPAKPAKKSKRDEF